MLPTPAPSGCPSRRVTVPMNPVRSRLVLRNDDGPESERLIAPCRTSPEVNDRFVDHPHLVGRGVGLEQVAVDPPKILAQGVEVDDGVFGTVESHLLDERAVQRLEAQVDGTLPGGRKLVDRAGKVAPYVTGLVPDCLRCVAAPERAGGEGKAVQKAVVARGAANPDYVATGGAREASS